MYFLPCLIFQVHLKLLKGAIILWLAGNQALSDSPNIFTNSQRNLCNCSPNNFYYFFHYHVILVWRIDTRFSKTTFIIFTLPNLILLLLFSSLFFINLFIYLFLAVLGLRFCARAFSSCGEWGPLFIAVRGPLTVAASPVVEHRLQTRRLSSCGSRA